MAKEWILNSATNRFQLNFKRSVGATSENIRKCRPKSVEEWRRFYFANVKSKEHLTELGRKLYVKITEVLQAEVADIAERDCIAYIENLVIQRTFDGYMTEIKTVYGQLEGALNRPIQPAPDKWDRLYNVDFYIAIGGKYIGIQIKPVNPGIQLSQIFKEQSAQKSAHKKFEKKYGGKVFYVFSATAGRNKTIVNDEVVDEIKNEIARLESAA